MPLAGFRSAIQRLIIPTSDLGMQEQAGGVLQFPDDLPPTLAVGAAMSQGAPRLVTGTKLGLATPGRQQSQLYLPTQTITASGNGPALDVSGFRIIQLYVRAVLNSGTSPTFWPLMSALYPDGNWWNLVGTNAAATNTVNALLTAGVGAASIGNGSFAAASAFNGQFPDQIRLAWLVTGTTPSWSVTAFLLAW